MSGNLDRPPVRTPDADAPAVPAAFPAEPAGLRPFAAFASRNYRLWFAGQLVSLFGSWMQSTALGFLVYELSHSAAYLGYVSFAASAPSWLFMLRAGVIADRAPRRTLLLMTQTAMMALALVLSGLTFSGLVAPWQIVIVAFGLGTANAFDAPARQAFVSELVPRKDLTNAIALNSTMFNAAVALGPAASGVVYVLLGPAWCFLVNTVSFLAVIAALLAMRLEPRPRAGEGTSHGGGLRDGLRFVAGHETVRVLIGLISVVSLVGLGFITLMPAWAKDVLGGDATTNGCLQSARGIGALTAALTVAALGRFTFKGKLLSFGTFFFPTLVLGFALVRWLPLSLILLVGAGFGLILIFNLCNALVQEHTPDELRGRVMSIYSLAFFGFLPIGGLLVGLLAEAVGEVWTLTVGALATLACAVLLAVAYPALRRL